MENRFQSVILNGISSVVSVLIRSILATIMGIYIIRNLGPHSFGIYAYTLGVIQIFFMFFSTGFLGVIVRDISKGEVSDNIIYNSSLIAQFTLLLISSFFVFGYVLLFRESHYYAFYLLGVMSIFILYLSTPNNGFFSGKEKLYVSSIIETLKTLLNFVLVIIFLYFLKEGPLGVLMASFLGNSLFFILSFLYLKKKFFLNITFKLDKGYIRRAFIPVFSFSLIGFLGYIFGQIDIVMIKHLLQIESVGVYSAAVRIYSLIISMIVSLSAIGYPVICKSIYDKNVNEEFVLKLYFKLMLIILGYVVFVSFCYSSDIFLLLIGSSYVESILPFKILSFSFIFVAYNIVVQQALYSYENEKLFIFIYLLLCVVNIFMNFILLPVIGIIAAAFSTLICHMLIAIILNFSCKKHFKDVSIFSKEVLKIIFLIIAMVLVLNYFFVDLYWIFSLFFLSFVYGLIIITNFMKVFNKEEIIFFIKNFKFIRV